MNIDELDEAKLLADTAKADRANSLLDNETLKEAFDYLEAKYMEAWRNTGISVDESYKRERLFQAVNILGLVKDHLRRVVDGGKLAKVQIDAIEGHRQAQAKSRRAA